MDVVASPVKHRKLSGDAGSFSDESYTSVFSIDVDKSAMATTSCDQCDGHSSPPCLTVNGTISHTHSNQVSLNCVTDLNSHCRKRSRSESSEHSASKDIVAKHEFIEVT